MYCSKVIVRRDSEKVTSKETRSITVSTFIQVILRPLKIYAPTDIQNTEAKIPNIDDGLKLLMMKIGKNNLATNRDMP